MNPISQPEWTRYIESARGQSTIALFERAQQADFSPEEMAALYKRFYDKRTLDDNVDQDYLAYFDEFIPDCLANVKIVQREDIFAFCDYGAYFISALDGDEEVYTPDTLPQNRYRESLGRVSDLSMILYKHAPSLFLPYFFTFQFVYLKRMAEKYDWHIEFEEGSFIDFIDLSDVPTAQHYKERWRYYPFFCYVLHAFAEENGLTPAELCAFLYDYELEQQKEEIEEEQDTLDLSTGQNVWFIGGTYEGIEKSLSTAVWQANPKTQRGDILVFYEKNPAKSINSIWRAVEEGTADPFFYYYSYTYMRNKLPIAPITLDELKADPYFKEHSLVKKNMQGVNGWPMTADDYKNLQRMLKAKGFDTSTLPKLIVHEAPEGMVYEDRYDGLTPEQVVHQKQVIPLLARMGWRKGRDFAEYVEYQVQHGKRKKKAVADFILHQDPEDAQSCHAVITVRYDLQNDKDIEDALIYCAEIAIAAEADVVVVVDKRQIIVVVPNDDNVFDLSDRLVLYHDEMNNSELFEALKQILDKPESPEA